MSVTFDRVHTAKKQRLLREMMDRTARRVAAMPNGGPRAANCQICESEAISAYVSAHGFDMARCAGCGLIFCDPYPNQEQLFAYYNSEMKDFENEFFRESFEARVEIFARRVDLIREVQPTGRLLDIGSAIGIFIESLRRSAAPFDVTACDLSAAACEELRERFPTITVLNKDAANLEETAAFDVVTMWDTLEHIVDLGGMLKTVHRLLKPDGAFFFSTPNTHSFEWLVAGDRHVQILPPGHVNLMNASNIQILLERNHFRVVDQKTLNASLDIGYVEKILAEDKIVSGGAGEFLKVALDDPEFKTTLADFLIRKTMAGNVVTVARPV
jgi:ubiquinone/menaquinone biosynthesis C-methylase UbiE